LPNGIKGLHFEFPNTLYQGVNRKNDGPGASGALLVALCASPPGGQAQEQDLALRRRTRHGVFNKDR
jgi:hypothetical protein